MNASDTSGRGRGAADVRLGLGFAALMLLIPLGARLASDAYGLDAARVSQRALMAILATYIVLVGNAVPKRLAGLACTNAGPDRMQAFQRFTGWVWVLTGLGLGAAWILRPIDEARVATLILVTLSMALVASSWLRLTVPRRPSA